MKLDTCIVVGASSGIGRALVDELVAGGSRVVALARREELLEELAGEHGERVWSLRCDTADRERVLGIADEIRERGWNPDAIFLNAGMGEAELPDFTVAKHRATFDVNYFGLFTWIEAFLPEFTERGHGTFVATSSLMAFRSLGSSAVAYGASKAAMTNAFEAFRAYCQIDGVQFVTVHPGPVDTAMLTTDGKVPFLWSTRKAARYTLRKLRRGKQEIDYPPIYAWAVRLTMFFPARLITWLTRRKAKSS